MSEQGRILAFISAATPWGELVESHTEHIAQSAAGAIDDISLAVFTATSRGELGLLRNLARTLIQKLEAVEVTAITLDEHFDDMRRTR